MTNEEQVLVADWFRRVRQSQLTHYECARHFSRLNYLLGIPAIVLAAAAGTAVFASLETVAGGRMRIVVGLVSLVSSVLSGLQTFLGLANRADQHRAMSAQYAAVRRSLEHLKTFPPSSPDDLKRQTQEIKMEMDNLAKASPEVPGRIRDKIEATVASRSHHRVFEIPAQSTAKSLDAKSKPAAPAE